MKAIAICGSPRASGNTEQLLRRCLERLGSHGIQGSLISLAELRIDHCTGCGVCRQQGDGRCAIDWDDFPQVFKDMVAADIILVGTPVYFGSATPQLMALLDRAGYVARGAGNLLAGKLGGPVVVARRAGQNFTVAQLVLWFLISGMIVPGSTYWNIAFGAEPGDALKDEEALATLDHFCDKLAELGGKLFASDGPAVV